MKKLSVFLFAYMFTSLSHAQILFGDRCLGTWKGTMHIYQYGILRDSVEVKMSVAKINDTKWTWKTEYLSAKTPMVKDYKLILKDKSKNLYITDEGEGLELTDYLTGNKLYSTFETHGVMLTASYELRGEELIFEVVSGKKEAITHPEVANYSAASVQRVIMKRVR
jgi:hypothetical protein